MGHVARKPRTTVELIRLLAEEKPASVRSSINIMHKLNMLAQQPSEEGRFRWVPFSPTNGKALNDEDKGARLGDRNQIVAAMRRVRADDLNWKGSTADYDAKMEHAEEWLAGWLEQWAKWMRQKEGPDGHPQAAVGFQPARIRSFEDLEQEWLGDIVPAIDACVDSLPMREKVSVWLAWGITEDWPYMADPFGVYQSARVELLKLAKKRLAIP
jgi:hypothetical protein